MPDDDALTAVRAALARADEILVLLDGVPVANTLAAQTAMTQTRLSVLERFHVDVGDAVAPSGD